MLTRCLTLREAEKNGMPTCGNLLICSLARQSGKIAGIEEEKRDL